MRRILVLTIVFIFAGGITLSSIMASAQEDYNIPAWIKNNAAWWSEGQIDDASFVSGITYMIENGIMEISQGDNQVANDKLNKENQELSSLLSEYQVDNKVLTNVNQELNSSLAAWLLLCVISIIPFSIMYFMPLTNEASSIWP